MKPWKLFVPVGAAALLLVAGPTMVGTAPAKASESHVIDVAMQDRCDPASFNAAIGEGTCVPTKHGKVTFDEFLTKLNPKDFGHNAWSFSSKRIDLKQGDTLRVSNTGGEGHSFTQVAMFGGGCVDELNAPLGLTPVPECPAAFATVQDPGTSVNIDGLTPGTYNFQCIIHPWMRATVVVK